MYGDASQLTVCQCFEIVRQDVPNGCTLATTVKVKHLIPCGVSNWAAYAIVGALASLHHIDTDALLRADSVHLEALDATLDAGAIDGCTGKRERSVDGLPWSEHKEVLHAIRKAVAPRAGT